jgi:hypothetical protein
MRPPVELHVALLVLVLAPAVCAQRYAVELDLPPSARWDNVMPNFRAPYAAAAAAFTAEAPALFATAAAVLAADAALAARIFPGELMAEFGSIGRALNISAARAAALALVYDLTASSRARGRACTGIVARAADGAIVHGRNLDYAHAELLKPLTIVVDFRRDGAVAFSATLWAGLPVFNTVQVAGGCARARPWSLSQNERDAGPVAANWRRLLAGTPATFATIRRVAETACSYDEALGMLRAAPLAAPSFFVLAGSGGDEGAVVARERDGAADVWRLADGIGGWYVLETNYDRTGPPAARDRRRAVVERFMARYGAARFGRTAMWLALSDRRANESAGERGVWNEETVFSQVMVQPRPPAAGGGGGTGAAAAAAAAAAAPLLVFQRRPDWPGYAPLAPELTAAVAAV